MAKDSEHDRIAAKAHELWEAAGRPHGQDAKHWEEAREIIAVQDSHTSTRKPRRTGAKAPVEKPAVALRNQADVPNLTDQGENLLTSTDREPPLTATPAGRKGRMPKAEVPTSDQPGIPPKAGRKAAVKPADANDEPPRTASVTSKAKAAAAKTGAEPKASRTKTSA